MASWPTAVAAAARGGWLVGAWMWVVKRQRVVHGMEGDFETWEACCRRVLCHDGFWQAAAVVEGCIVSSLALLRPSSLLRRQTSRSTMMAVDCR